MQPTLSTGINAGGVVSENAFRTFRRLLVGISRKAKRTPKRVIKPPGHLGKGSFLGATSPET